MSDKKIIEFPIRQREQWETGEEVIIPYPDELNLTDKYGDAPGIRAVQDVAQTAYRMGYADGKKTCMRQ